MSGKSRRTESHELTGIWRRRHRHTCNPEAVIASFCNSLSKDKLYAMVMKTMDWKLFAQLAVTLIVAVLGGWIGHYLSMRRDLTAERRKLRVTYLLEAYRRLEGASNPDDPKQCRPDLESAVADIQLLGSPHQVSLARQFANEMARNRTSSLDDLLFDLRQSLRSELELEPVSENVIFLRFGE